MREITLKLTEQDVSNVLFALKKMWANGEVRAEEVGATLGQLRQKIEVQVKAEAEKEIA